MVIGPLELVELILFHTVSALGRLIDKYGVYLSHLSMLTEDVGVKGVDKQKIKGYTFLDGENLKCS